MSTGPATGHLVVRADTRPGVGAGHAMRQLALLERWQATGGTAAIVVDDPDPWLARRLEASGAEVSVIPPGAGLGISDLVGRATDAATGWVVLDGYDFGAVVQQQVAATGASVAVVDDHASLGAQGPYVADVVVDPDMGPVRPGHQRRPRGSAFLHGPRFALLRREFRSAVRAPLETKSRVVVLAGGQRPGAGEGLADRLQDALGTDGVEVTTPDRSGCRDQVAALLGTARLAVSAAGSTAWELAHLGVPSVLYAVADNQEPVGQTLAEAGAARYVGRIDGRIEVDRGLIEATVDLHDDVSAQHELSANATGLVDGRGAARVGTELQAALVELRAAQSGDARLLWSWANDPAVRAASFSSDGISWEDHVRWFKAKEADPGCRIYVAMAADGPWGQVRFDRIEASDQTADIGLSVAAHARGAGAAAPLIRAAVRRLFAETQALAVSARVREENIASTTAFLNADFEVAEAETGRPVRLVYSRGRDGRD